ncbi:MAG: formate--tetrahydrofolate ligase [Verrucomicrobiales bacterium]
MTDIEIARAADYENIANLAFERFGLNRDHLICYGHHKAKLDLESLGELDDKSQGSLILVTAISPTPAGEGKTTTTIGLGDGLSRIGKQTMICLREPSLGPSFGMKGGATGGGHSQIVPMEEINLHFTGDFHAITSANNLLSAMIDNHLHWGNQLQIDPRKISWRRCMDLNDRSLRNLITGMGNVRDYPRETGFDITVASEVMAILCLSNDLKDLERRLGRIVIGRTYSGEDVHASDLKAEGAMTVLLKDALNPNLVQTLEHTPALVHGGPFANIAHGCNSVVATRTAQRLADYVVTEAGFGADLGAEKFFDIKCRKAGLKPRAAVIVATIRALKYHGGIARKQLNDENVNAVERGFANLERHLENIGKFGIPSVVAVNAFASDTEAETQRLLDLCRDIEVPCVLATHWADGGKGAEDLARQVVDLVDQNSSSAFQTLYPDKLPLVEKLRTVAQEIYRADDIELSRKAERKLNAWQETEAGDYPVCIAKTPYSFSAEPEKRGAATDFLLPVRDVALSAGAGFVVALTGDIMTMPGLPKVPVAERILLNPEGEIDGLS